MAITALFALIVVVLVVYSAITYRDDLASHPGCSTAGMSYPAADLPGYPCAAKAYAFPSGGFPDRWLSHSICPRHSIAS